MQTQANMKWHAETTVAMLKSIAPLENLLKSMQNPILYFVVLVL
jgi:hypothetical protein